MKSFFPILTICFSLLFICDTQFLGAQDSLLIKADGTVVIGKVNSINTPAGYKLYVESGILTERVKVSLKNSSQWSDDAFNYTPSVETVEQSINNKAHLHAMPSVATLIKEGYELKSMDAKLLAQIEWLWQHTIRMDKENQALKARISKLEEQQKP